MVSETRNRILNAKQTGKIFIWYNQNKNIKNLQFNLELLQSDLLTLAVDTVASHF